MATRLAVFASGTGSNFEAIADACQSGRLDAEVVLMVCDKPTAAVVGKAASRGIDSFVFSPKDYPSKEEFEREIISRLAASEVDLVCLAGYMRIIGDVLLNEWGGRIINIHPALLPSFKGAHAIEDAWNYGVKVFGVTVHYVTAEVDGGRIIAQGALSYEDGTIEDLTQRIHEIEHLLYPEAIERTIKELQTK